MKKLVMIALVIATASGACAQDNLWKKAQSLCDSKKLDEALTTIQPCLTSDQTMKKADAWNTMCNIQYEIFLRENTIGVNNKKNNTQIPYDTLAMNEGVAGALEAALECDKYDAAPNAKGKVKLRFRQANALKISQIRPLVINSGLYAYNHKDLKKAYKYFSLYIDSSNSPLFSLVKTGDDPYLGTVSYYASLVAYNLKDYDGVKKYVSYALADSAVAKEAEELNVYTYKDLNDSVNFFKSLVDAHAKFPDEQKYFDMLINFYLTKGDQAATMKFAQEEMARDSNNKSASYVMGVVLMNEKKWDDAMTYFKKAISIDPDYMEANFNIGVCYNSKASEMRDKAVDKRGNMTTDAYNKILPFVKESRIYLEKARQLAPDRKDLWAYPLYSVYYALKETAKASEMEKILKAK